MSEETDADGETEQRAPSETRSTAPQSPYTAKRVLIGAVVAVIGLAVVFGVPLALTL